MWNLPWIGKNLFYPNSLGSKYVLCKNIKSGYLIKTLK